MKTDEKLVVVKGAGDIATGVAYRLMKCGFRVILTELKNPLVIRRTVAFAEAVYAGSVLVEGLEARHADSAATALSLIEQGIVPVMVDPDASVVNLLKPEVVVDAIMAKKNSGTRKNDAPLVIGIGPGFTAGEDVHTVVETKRGHSLGRVIYSGTALPNTGVPGSIGGYTTERLLKAPVDGVVIPKSAIGQRVERGEVVAKVDGVPVKAGLTGIIRGMIREGLKVPQGTKIGDVDPRGSKEDCFTISDKALAVAGGVLESVFAFYHNRSCLSLLDKN